MDYQRSGSHSANFATGVTCYSCGRHGHKWSDPNCPARNGHCYYCGKNGHFANCCNNKYKRRRPPSFNSGRHDSEEREDITTSTVSVSAVDCCKSRRNSKRIHRLLDGAHSFTRRSRIANLMSYALCTRFVLSYVYTLCDCGAHDRFVRMHIYIYVSSACVLFVGPE